MSVKTSFFSKWLWLICAPVWLGAVSVPAFSQAGEVDRRVEPASRRMSDAQIVRDIQDKLGRLAAQDRMSGAVLVAKNGKILFENAYGFANHAFNAKNRVDTKFNLGSMNKMFTAVAIMQLAQRGKLSVDDTLGKLLADYPNKDAAAKVTVHQLLTHTSGLDDFDFGEIAKQRPQTLEAYLPLFASKPLVFEPGAKFDYCNANFLVLGLIVQRLSGQDYYDYVREHIFQPAGMVNTESYRSDEDVPNLALGYTRIGPNGGLPQLNKPRRLNIGGSVGRGIPAGGGYATVEDLLRFAQALTQHKLLDETHTDLLMTGHVDTGPPERAKYGYGMFERFENGVRIVGHSGGAPGISSNLDIYPALGYVVAVMSNYDQGSMLTMERTRWMLTGHDIPHPVRVSSDILKTYQGKYTTILPPDTPKGRFIPPFQIVAAGGANLALDFGKGMGAQKLMKPLSATEFFDDDDPEARYIFSKDEKGQVVMTAMGQGSPVKNIKQP